MRTLPVHFHATVSAWALGAWALGACALGGACGYRVLERARAVGGASTVYVEAPEVSRAQDPRIGPILRRALVFELRRRGVDLGSARDAQLDLVLCIHRLNGSDVFVSGQHIGAEDLELAIEAIARPRRGGPATWRSGRVVVRRARPWGRSLDRAEAALQVAMEGLAGEAARLIARGLTGS